MLIIFGGLIQVVFVAAFCRHIDEQASGTKGFRVILFLPYVLHSVATVIMFKNVYHAEYGSLNSCSAPSDWNRGSKAGSAIQHLVNFSLAFISMWKYMGLNMVIFIGALQSIPDDLYEAAQSTAHQAGRS